MKQPKKLTRRQKEIVKKYKLLPEKWMCISEDAESLLIINKKSKNIRKLWK